MKHITNCPAQKFVLPDEVLAPLSVSEVEATYAAMQDADIAKPPFEAFDIAVNMLFRSRDGGSMRAPVLLRYQGNKTDMLMTNTHTGKLSSYFDHIAPRIEQEGDDPLKAVEVIEQFRKILIVLLATRNIIKEVKEHKLAKLGIGKSKYRFITTLKVGTITETETTGTGAPKRPHLRRGHLRHQHHGKDLQEVKLIFIQAVFVNSDRQWVGDRLHYLLKP